MKENTLATEMAGINTRRLINSYTFKLPRITQIRKYRDLYNNKTVRQLRIRYNVPIPIFSGMIDTLAAQLDDGIILKIAETDPADWLGVQKADAAMQEELASESLGAQWNATFRSARNECIFTGVGIPKFIAGKNTDGYFAKLTDVAFEDFYFETKAKDNAANLENHLFAQQGNIWLTETELIAGAADGTYNKAQVKELLAYGGGSEYKQSDYWGNFDYANRFQSMNLASESNNYVGERVFNFIEAIGEYKGRRWYQLIEAFTGTWIRFEKWEDLCSSEEYPWKPFHSHGDKKNFATKAFADDLYPMAISMMDMFNDDMEGRKRRLSGARAFDKDMFPNVQQLDEAMLGRDRLVSVDTKGGTRKIADGIYHFETPDISGTIDALKYMEDLIGRNLGITAQMQGDEGDPNKAVGVSYNESAAASKRISFTAQPIIHSAQQCGIAFVTGLKDYLTEPMSIKLYGETGFEWSLLKRIDLNFKRPPKIIVNSQSAMNRQNEMKKANKTKALNDAAARVPSNPNINYRMVEEYNLRDVGEFTEAEIALLLDTNSTVDKKTIAETSAAIQDLMMGRVPPINYNAGGYFMNRLLDFAMTNQGDKKVKKNYMKFMNYIMAHKDIAAANESRRADAFIQEAQEKAAMNPTGGAPGAPGATPPPKGAPAQAAQPAEPAQAAQPAMSLS